MTVTLDQSDTKIRELLLMGNSVDVLAEQGTQRGWTRADILRVASANGWELDPSGRIPRTQRTPTLAPTAPRPAPPAVAPAAPADVPPLWRALAAGRAHPVPAIRKRADRLLEQLQDLAKTIEGAEEERKVRDRLAELDAEREQLRATLGMKTGTPGRKPKPIDHGTVGGYQAHKRRDEPMCDDCQAAGDAHMDRMRAARKPAES